ncbi:3-hydroxy-3-methylglutaryl-coenzyme A reductase (mvaA) [Stappia aggregata IAM 12614]|uniref:3-hydroxy-3-methylglutaryl coenzyme A reductase n=1 Tax=Roseibium aggregatum (strain ATCC 25650 / DSM 13394 / JCM 20685 / NBRC 16684 / NCIMB 2208 / IAM 12614 / B1) TaxID=384765 RepID=A0NZU0_ROSAI|nr:hydroxymethylglutaryl-CoA reductase, degradative [Roseibium aggregatum]EAV41657.1 3-hydroxy-3-methylglutaryl-coenzyme A reductase (mvaA) [Stappia aggregata IAM 12614] [Roseibium aggregatum IAM 12614]
MSDVTSSRIEGFHKLDPSGRLLAVQRQAKLDNKSVSDLVEAASGHIELADRLVENAISSISIPVGIATNMTVDGRDVLVPMASEESSVIAAVCNSAKRCRSTGGFKTSTSGPLMAAQIQLLGVSDPENVRLKVLERIDDIRTICEEIDPLLVKLGGGFRDLDIRVIDTAEGPMTIVHIIVDTRDAMGANAVNSMAEALAPKLEEWTGARSLLRILTNLADRRVARVRAVWPLEEIGGEKVRDDMLSAYHFADADPYRAATHNKGIMNGISAVVLATGNDTRAVEAGAHAFAARDGRYRSMSRWEKDGDGNLVGILELPMAVGLIGGATKIHPTAQANLKILGVTTADELARIIVAVGLAQNFGALRALATTGIQKGHMGLHAQNVALMVGATGEEIDQVASELKALGKVRQDLAEEILARLRQGDKA